jgi:hypothetical protein
MSERTLKVRHGELDLLLKPWLTYYDMKQLRGFAELAAKDHYAAIDILVEIFWKCAHAGDAAVTKEMIEKKPSHAGRCDRHDGGAFPACRARCK